MATYSSILAWRIPGTGEPGRLPFMGSHTELDTTEATYLETNHESSPKTEEEAGLP